jgi:hypothetical protein
VADIAALNTGMIDDVAERRLGVTATVEECLGGFDDFALGLSVIAGHGCIVVVKQRTRAMALGLTPGRCWRNLPPCRWSMCICLSPMGRHLILSRYTQPEKDLQLLLDQLKLSLPEQLPPKITRQHPLSTCANVVPTIDGRLHYYQYVRIALPFQLRKTDYLWNNTFPAGVSENNSYNPLR